MFTSAVKHLTIQSPSSTTISYTVSNAQPRTTRASKLFYVLGDVFRVVLCAFVLSVDLARLQSTPYFQQPLKEIIDFEDGRFDLSLAIGRALDWRVLAVGSIIVLYLCLKKAYTGEEILPLNLLFVQRLTTMQKRVFWCCEVSEYRQLRRLRPTCQPQPLDSYLRLKYRILSSMKPSRASRFDSTWPS